MAKLQPASGWLRLNLTRVNASLEQVEIHWKSIDDELDRSKIGRKDTPFQQLFGHGC